MSRVFIDTSFWFSLAVQADANHRNSVNLAARLQDEGSLWYLSTLVAAETHRLILHKIGISAGQQWLDQLLVSESKGFLHILPVDSEGLIKARRILSHYGDQKITLTDAASAVLMLENDVDGVAGYDRHFEIMGFERLP